jgi:hypothetical protein
MTENQLRLLREVAGGKWNFRCVSWRPQDLEAFQAVADDLLRLEAMGYLARAEALPETRTGRQYVDRVFVRGGVTEEGREALKDHS